MYLYGVERQSQSQEARVYTLVAIHTLTKFIRSLLLLVFATVDVLQYSRVRAHLL